jgi:hypothetical protein
LETKSSSAQVVMTHCILSVVWHGKVAKPFKARSPELTVLGFGMVVPPPCPSVCPSSSERSQRVQVVGASLSPSNYEAFEVMLGSSLVMFPVSHERWCSLLLLPVDALGCHVPSSGLLGVRW